MPFKLQADFSPCGDQPQAIEKLVAGIRQGKQSQVLLGVTGSGKTFTMAHVVAKVQKPTLVLAHNKTLAAQLYQEFKGFFPHNAVEYFVSYYDYYQPEAYIPRTDTYIEKDLSINEEIEKMRLSATRSLLEREDVLIVASVSCIYGLGMPEHYAHMRLSFHVGEEKPREALLLQLVHMHYTRNDFDFSRGSFRVRGDVLEIFPAYEGDQALRIEFWDETVERISQIDPLTGKVITRLPNCTLYPGSHYVTPESVRMEACARIREELEQRVAYFEAEGKLVEKERIQQRTLYDLEMIEQVGFCKGIENYSRPFSGRQAGEPPSCLLDYFPSDFLLFIDESHQTVGQMHAMYNGDRARKQTLVDYGFRLPSAYDNRPLRFEEAYSHFHRVVYVSATPNRWEIQEAKGEIIEQIIRPTGLLDPEITILPAKGQIDDVIEQIRLTLEQGGRVLVTTLTKRLSEDLTQYLLDIGIATKYLHSDIDTLERIQILRDLRLGVFHVLVGINLLREGLDLPEVALVAILDADKEGFLRSEAALIQTCGRAARNVAGRVVMYADRETPAIRNTCAITQKRRALQMAYNAEHGIIPRTIRRELGVEMGLSPETSAQVQEDSHRWVAAEEGAPYLTAPEIEQKIQECEKQMKEAAQAYRFEEAAHHRDQMRAYQELALRLGSSD